MKQVLSPMELASANEIFRESKSMIFIEMSMMHPIPSMAILDSKLMATPWSEFNLPSIMNIF